jgi:hypothetical protein
MPPMRTALLGLLAAVTPLPAQDDPVRWHLVDTVIATVNDGAILWSELRTIAAGEQREAEKRAQRPLRPQERAELYQYWLDQLIDRHAMAQGAKTFGVVPPEAIERQFQEELRADEQEQEKNAGSFQAFSEALQLEGRTWQSYEREQRLTKMSALADYLTIEMRMQKQKNLFLTPRMLRETWDDPKVRSQFVHPASALVGLVTFRGANALADANAAAETWRQQELSPSVLAERFPGAIGVNSALEASTLVPALASFGLAGPQGAVSAPIEVTGGFQIGKVVRFQPAANAEFQDPEVQAQLRRICQRNVEAEFRQQALQRAMTRAEVWVTPAPLTHPIATRDRGRPSAAR